MSSRRVALVTGATRGIGAAIAMDFAKKGYDLGITGRDESELAQHAQQAESLGAKVFAIAGDLADMAFVEALVPKAIDSLGRVDALVNNAAWREVVTMRQISLESWEKTLRVCLTAPAFLSKHAAADMETRGSGVIINISSIMSEHSAGYAPAYVACKGAMDTLTFDLAALYGSRGIRVVSVNPGAIDTDMGKGYGDDAGDRAMREFSENMIPLRRWGTPDEMAKLVTWLAGDEASYITGTCIVADGGWSRQFHPYNLKKNMMPEQFQ